MSAPKRMKLMKTEHRVQSGAILSILEMAQTNECMHTKYFGQLNELYKNPDTDTEHFGKQLLKAIKLCMQQDDKHKYATILLNFCGRYLAKLANDGMYGTHPLLRSIFEFFWNFSSKKAHIRYRMCQFVNTIMAFMDQDAAFEDSTFRKLMDSMLDHLQDDYAAVRVQAIEALQRLQFQSPHIAEYRNKIHELYQFHLESDPSAAVRIATVSAIEFSPKSMPMILERLWDVDEKVRRHTYKRIMEHPVRSLRVVHRFTILEQGLHDASAEVRKTVTSELLPKWFHAYGCNYIKLLSALKIDADETEINRFMKIAKQCLRILFKNKSNDELIAPLPLMSETNKFGKCVPFDKLKVEMIVYWATLIEYIQSAEFEAIEDDDHGCMQQIICDLSTFTEYLSKFLKDATPLKDVIDVKPKCQWWVQEYNYKINILTDILLLLDASDEIGKKALTTFVEKALTSRVLEASVLQKLVLAMEDAVDPLQFFIAIVHRCINPVDSPIDLSKHFLESILERITGSALSMKQQRIISTRLRILELREKRSIAKEQREYSKVHKINDQLKNLEREWLSLTGIDSQNRQESYKPNESILQCLRICYFVITSKRNYALTPELRQLYDDFILPQTESRHEMTRDWALKCDIAFSLNYVKKQKVHVTYCRLRYQILQLHLSKQTNKTNIWITLISGIFELIDRFGFDLADHSTEVQSTEELMISMLHLMDTTTDIGIKKATIIGFCRLALSGRCRKPDAIAKLLSNLFDSKRDSEIEQILLMFFKMLVERKQQDCMVDALVRALQILHGYSCPQRRADSELLVKFVADSTQSITSNSHNRIAYKVLDVMIVLDPSFELELMKDLSKGLNTLRVSNKNTKINNNDDDDSELFGYDSIQKAMNDLLRRNLDAQVKKNLQKFQQNLSAVNTE